MAIEMPSQQRRAASTSITQSEAAIVPFARTDRATVFGGPAQCPSNIDQIFPAGIRILGMLVKIPHYGSRVRRSDILLKIDHRQMVKEQCESSMTP